MSDKFCFLGGAHAYAYYGEHIFVNSGSGEAAIYLLRIDIFTVINNNSD
jgi:hypothetical protein